MSDSRSRCPAEQAQLACDGLFFIGITSVAESSPTCLPVRLRGAGGDGGSTGAESRSSYLEMYKEKKEDKVDPSQQRHARWTRCAYSGKPLQAPIVADPLGNLFNKAEVLEGLAARTAGTALPASLAHIRLKDLFTVHAQANPSYEQDTAGAAQEETGVRPHAEAPFECPLTGCPLNGRGRTFLHKPTCLVLTESGLNKAPKVASELILEAARKRLEEIADSAAPENGTKGKKKAAALAVQAARARLEAIVSRGGKWEQAELLVLNPEGNDAEVAKGRLHAMQTKAKAKSAAADATGVKRASAVAGPAPAGQGKRAKSVLQSLFHSDAEVAVTQETYCCRSTSARGFVS
eukprot:jgi/Ulvmu1/995/UM103_0023.1